MPQGRRYYVYIMTNIARTLYTGVTNDLEKRVYQHKNKAFSGVTSRYGLDRLAYFEVTDDIHAAIAREKKIKGWVRARKVSLVEAVNPEWEDLSPGW
jgi:putative endonuclease